MADSLRRRARSTLATAVVLIALTACVTAQHPVDPTTRPLLDARDVLKFQYHGGTVAIHAVKYAGDSLSGTDWREATGERVSYAIAEVTRAEVVRYGEEAPRKVGQVTFFAVFGILFLFTLLQSGMGGGSGS